jgi:hypothetical protein
LDEVSRKPDGDSLIGFPMKDKKNVKPSPMDRALKGPVSFELKA